MQQKQQQLYQEETDRQAKTRRRTVPYPARCMLSKPKVGKTKIDDKPGYLIMWKDNSLQALDAGSLQYCHAGSAALMELAALTTRLNKQKSASGRIGLSIGFVQCGTGVWYYDNNIGTPTNADSATSSLRYLLKISPRISRVLICPNLLHPFSRIQTRHSTCSWNHGGKYQRDNHHDDSERQWHENNNNDWTWKHGCQWHDETTTTGFGNAAVELRRQQLLQREQRQITIPQWRITTGGIETNPARSSKNNVITLPSCLLVSVSS